MPNYSFVCVVGQPLDGRELVVRRGDSVTVAITLRNADGTPYDATGQVVSLDWRASGSGATTLSRRAPRKGNATGLYTFTIPVADCAYFPNLRIRWDAALEGPPYQQLIEEGDITGEAGTGPVMLTTDTLDGTPEVVLPDVQQIFEFVALLDLPGDSHPLTARDAARAPFAVPTGFRVSCPQLQATTGAADPGATGAIYLSRDGSPIGVPALLTQTATGSGIFAGAIDSFNQVSVGAAQIFQYVVVITTDGVSYAACLPSDLTYVSSGKPANIPPTVTLTSPASGATVAPGTVVVTGTATDPDDVLTADSCTAVVDGIATADVVTLTSGSGTGSIGWRYQTTLATIGAHSLGCRVSDPKQGVGSAQRTVTAAQPVLTILSPTGTIALDEGPVVVFASTDLAVPGTTELRVYEGASLLGTGTLAEGATTSVLSAGQHTLTAQITTPAGVVTSAPKTVTLEAQSPTDTIVSPADGAIVLPATTLVVQVNVTHPSGAAAVSHVRIWRDSETPVTASRVGTTDIWQATIATVATEASLTLHSDAVDLGGSTTTASTTTVSLSYTRPWAGGVQALNQTFARTQAPSSGALTLTLSAGAESSTLEVLVPAHASDPTIVIPEGYTWDIDPTAAPGIGAAIGKWEPRIPGEIWRAHFVLDVAGQRFKVAAESQPRALPSTAVYWPLNTPLAYTWDATTQALVRESAADATESADASGTDLSLMRQGETYSTTPVRGSVRYLRSTQGSGSLGRLLISKTFPAGRRMIAFWLEITSVTLGANGVAMYGFRGAPAGTGTMTQQAFLSQYLDTDNQLVNALNFGGLFAVQDIRISLADAKVSAGDWIHVAMIYGGATGADCRLYINCALVASATATAAPIEAVELYFAPSSIQNNPVGTECRFQNLLIASDGIAVDSTADELQNELENVQRIYRFSSVNWLATASQKVLGIAGGSSLMMSGAEFDPHVKALHAASSGYAYAIGGAGLLDGDTVAPYLPWQQQIRLIGSHLRVPGETAFAFLDSGLPVNSQPLWEQAYSQQMLTGCTTAIQHYKTALDIARRRGWVPVWHRMAGMRYVVGGVVRSLETSEMIQQCRAYAVEFDAISILTRGRNPATSPGDNPDNYTVGEHWDNVVGEAGASGESGPHFAPALAPFMAGLAALSLHVKFGPTIP